MRRAYENLIVERVLDSLSRPPPMPLVFPVKQKDGPADSAIESRRRLNTLSSIGDETEGVELALMRQIDTLTTENIALQHQIEALKVSLGVGTVESLQAALPTLLKVPAEARAESAHAVRGIMHMLVDWVAGPFSKSAGATPTASVPKQGTPVSVVPDTPQSPRAESTFVTRSSSTRATL